MTKNQKISYVRLIQNRNELNSTKCVNFILSKYKEPAIGVDSGSFFNVCL